jgi:hypothetical protein
MNIKPDRIRDKEAMNLMKMVDIALSNYNLETCLNSRELPLGEEIMLNTANDEGNLVVCAVTKFSVIDVSGEHIKFLKLDRYDIYTLQDYIHDMYEVEY